MKTKHAGLLLIVFLAVLPIGNPAIAVGSDAAGLFAAADKGDLAKIKQMLAAGVNVNAADSDGWTALMVAASAGKLPAAQALVKAGANVNATTGKGETPLMAAALSGNAAIVKLLLSEGADKRASSAQGLMAADVAIRAKHPELVKLLQPAQVTTGVAAPPPAASAKKIEAKVDAAASAFQSGRYAEAAALFREVVALDPRHALAWHFLGQSLAKNGDPEGALNAFQKSLEIQPSGNLAQRNQLFLSKQSSERTSSELSAPVVLVTFSGDAAGGRVRVEKSRVGSNLRVNFDLREKIEPEVLRLLGSNWASASFIGTSNGNARYGINISISGIKFTLTSTEVTVTYKGSIAFSRSKEKSSERDFEVGTTGIYRQRTFLPTDPDEEILGMVMGDLIRDSLIKELSKHLDSVEIHNFLGRSS